MLSAPGGHGKPPAVRGREQYCWTMTELVATGGGIVVLLAVVVLIGFVAYWAFGPQAIGLPALIGLFTAWGLLSLVSNAGLGPVGIVVIVGGVLAVLLIIGMAMRFGADPSTRVDQEKQREES
jgi:hypothetical protein